MRSELHDYWNQFYAGRRSGDVPEQPSAFATWVQKRIPVGATIWEFGFGTARDSVWFSARGHSVRGFDFAEVAVERAREVASKHQVDAAFQVFDLYDVIQARRLVDAVRDSSDGVNIYGRFLLHSLEDIGRHHLLDIAAGVLRGGSLFVEFRTGDDAHGPHLFGDDHYRQFLDPDVVAAEVEERGGHVVERVQGQGLAVYKTEDPHIARMVARWDR